MYLERGKMVVTWARTSTKSNFRHHVSSVCCCIICNLSGCIDTHASARLSRGIWGASEWLRHRVELIDGLIVATFHTRSLSTMQRLPSKRKPSKATSSAQQQRKAEEPGSSDEKVIDLLSSPTSVTVATSPDATSAAYEEREDDSTTPITEKIGDDVFQTPEDDHAAESPDEDSSGAFASGYEELPVEIQSLMERFLESLVTKSNPSALSVDRLSELYQDFYEHANGHINTHIAALSIKLSRETSPTPSISSAQSSHSRGSARRKPPDRRGTLQRSSTTDSQMLTPDELTDRRKARRQLELKRQAMEEAVERGICEKVYPRLWRHQSTDDEARDEKLRSRAAALALVGVDLKELLSTALSDDSALNSALQSSPTATIGPARDGLAEAREELEDMNNERYPLGKLNHLMAAHKAIVEALQSMFPTASSADEVLPTLIYSIITSKPESSSVVSNFNFIQRFRATNKVDGETAYCLTNLEAAISFLETVDLSSIRSNEAPAGPLKSPSLALSPQTELSDPMYRGLPSSPPKVRLEGPKTQSSIPTRNRPRALSGSLRPFEAASDVVRSSAHDIHQALDGGFKFLFGRLREQQAASSPVGSPTPAAPKTLEDAKRLVSQEDTLEDSDSLHDENTDISYAGQPQGLESQKLHGLALAEEALKLINGSPRDRSVDSHNSSVGRGSKESSQRKPAPLPKQPSPINNAAYNPVDSFRNIGNALNPFKGFAGIGASRSATRSPTTSIAAAHSSPPVTAHPPRADGLAKEVVAGNRSGSNSASGSGIDWSGIAPPIERFMQCIDARELNGYDVDLLLRDYQRLGGAAGVAGRSRDAKS